MRLSTLAATVVVAVTGWAGSAAAAAYVFDIHVTERLVGLTGFVPFEANFQQTWFVDPTPGPTVTEVTTFNTRVTDASDLGSATRTRTPFTDALEAASGLPLPIVNTAGSSVEIETNTTTLGAPFGHTNVSFVFRQFAFDTLGGDFSRTRTYTNQIVAFLDTPPPFQAPIDDPQLYDLLLALGPLPWFEFGADVINTNGITTGGTNIVYRGTATLHVAATVPEPAAWGLMILGFAAAGAVLRRQRTALAAPGRPRLPARAW
jgi:hypothetical protein